MEFLKAAVQKSFDILRFRHYIMLEVAHNDTYNRSAVMLFLAPPAINFLLVSLRFGNASGYFMSVLLAQIFSVAVFSVSASFLAKKFFHGMSPHRDFFRVMGHASIIYGLTILPFALMALGISGVSNLYSMVKLIADIWFTAVAWSALNSIHRLSAEHTILTVVLSIVVTMVVKSIAGEFISIGGI